MSNTRDRSPMEKSIIYMYVRATDRDDPMDKHVYRRRTVCPMDKYTYTNIASRDINSQYKAITTVRHDKYVGQLDRYILEFFFLNAHV